MRAMLDGRVSRARYYANISAPRWDQAMDEHREILSALKTRDGARLGSVLKRHLANKLETLKSVLRAQDETIT
ncbi:MAG: FCD domain-containing protein [Gammaproteobacteria bacterium]|nr:FCD domain-containing protein [Gammaproteobacteria bacterium]NIT17009.1 FCD domain-containing protein [Gammaproteobacteria bacterium]